MGGKPRWTGLACDPEVHTANVGKPECWENVREGYPEPGYTTAVYAECVTCGSTWTIAGGEQFGCAHGAPCPWIPLGWARLEQGGWSRRLLGMMVAVVKADSERGIHHSQCALASGLLRESYPVLQRHGITHKNVHEGDQEEIL